MKIIRLRMLLLVKFFLFIVSINHFEAQITSSNDLTKFKQENNVTKIVLDKNGIPSFIEGKISLEGQLADGIEKSYKFFDKYSGIYRMKNPRGELSVLRSKKDELGMVHVKLSQTYKGIKVYGKELVTHFSPEGDLKSINGEFLPDLNISIDPQITMDAATRKALSEIVNSSDKTKPILSETNLVIYSFQNKIYLAWNFIIATNYPSHRWEYFIDASNGEIIFKADRIMYNLQEKTIGKSIKSDSATVNKLIIEKILDAKSLDPEVQQIFKKKHIDEQTTKPKLDENSTNPEVIQILKKKHLDEHAVQSKLDLKLVTPEIPKVIKKNNGYELIVSGNLSIPTIGLSLNPIKINETETITATINNTGDASVSNREIRYYISDNNIITTSDYYIGNDYITLSASQSTTKTKAFVPQNISGLIPGTYYVGILIPDENEYWTRTGTLQIDAAGQDADAIGTGIGVMGDQKNHIDTYGHSGSFQLIDRTRRANNNPHNHNGQMRSDQSIETRLYPNNTAMVDNDNIWNNSSQAAGVDAQVYSGRVYDYFFSQFARNSYDDKGSEMLSIVDRNDGNDNAFCNGSTITFYTVTSGHRSMAGSIDIVAHEWAHAITANESGLKYEKESGALNESFSDMVAIAVGFATGIDPDWQQGEHFNIDGSAERDLSNPHAGRYPQPDTYLTDAYWKDISNCTVPIDTVNDNCWVHYNSGVPNKMFYLLSQGGTHNGITVTGIGISNAIKIMYRANANNYWSPTSTFENAKQGCISAANDLDASGNWATQTKKAWEAVKVGAENYTITTNPVGRQIIVDGTTYTSPQTFSTWTAGSQHSISLSSPQSGGTGTQYVWSSWSDGGAISHTITIPNSATTYTANFTTQYYLTMSPVTGGTVTPSNGWYNAGQSVHIDATPSSNYIWGNWSGTGTGSYTGTTKSTSITMNGPITQTANFTPTTSASIKPIIASTTIPKGTEFWVEIKVGDPNAVNDLYGISFRLSSNNSNCTYVDQSAAQGDFLGASVIPFSQKYDNQTVDIAITKTSTPGASGSGTVAKAKFTSSSNITSDQTVVFSFSNIVVNNSIGNTIPMTSATATVTIIATVNVNVWPGDCNNDLTVSAADILPIGQYYGQTISTPNNQGSQWIAYSRQPWASDGTIPKRIYADANGDGTINATDVLPIGLNYGKTHSSSNSVTFLQAKMNSIESIEKTLANASLKLVGPFKVKNNTNFTIQVVVGDPVSVTDLYGISFKIRSNNSTCTFIENTAQQGLFLGGNALNFFQTVDNQTVDAALTKISPPGVSGNGTIATFDYISTNDQTVIISLSDVYATDSQGNTILLDVLPTSILVDVRVVNEIPKEYSLTQNYPNPFNPSTKIRFNIPQQTQVKLSVYDILGREVCVLMDKDMNPGIYELTFDGSNLSSGVYFYKLKAGIFSQIKKFLLIK